MQSHISNQQEDGRLDLWGDVVVIDLRLILKLFLQVPIFPSFQPLGQSVFVQVLDKDGNPLEDNYKGKYPPCFIGQPGEVLKMSKDESDGPKIVTYGPFDKQTNLILNFNESGKIVEAKIKSACCASLLLWKY